MRDLLKRILRALRRDRGFHYHWEEREFRRDRERAELVARTGRGLDRAG